VARFPGMGAESPITRWVVRATGGKLTPRGVRIASLSAATILGLGLVALVFAVQVSSTPTFCGSCHIMKPYYESWKGSQHSKFACVECHIPPGITSEIRKKYEAISMVARYFTGTYGTNPWAEVDDAACLRCHERRLLEGKEVFHGVLFDHTPHLTESRRGLRLRCTSCHSQIVQGSHISVTSSTCALCHFMGEQLNTGVARCRGCHEIPDRVVTASGASFDHGEVGRLDMECTSCHGSVVRGTGNVPRERCVTCHNQQSRLNEYGNTDLLHRKHVSEHKVDCMNCHLVIEHGRAETPSAAAAGGAGACAACHGSGHSPQQDLYAGVGGRGVPRMPGPMFTAGVTCEGCHNPGFMAAPAASGELSGVHTVRASDVSCMACHGPQYRSVFLAWKTGLAQRTAALRPQLETTGASLGLTPPQAFEDARYNYLLVERGRGVHNVNFAYALLEKAHEQMNAARKERGLGALPRPWPEISAGSSNCLTCHLGVERQAGTFEGHRFDHGPHLTQGRLDCSSCHRPHAERAPGEIVKFGERGCVPCHHPRTAAEAPACIKCHGDITKRTVTSFRGEFSHQAHLEMGLECATCHTGSAGDPRPERSTCQQCHVDG
jgi:predicted CXXCH cytochrome family protein